MTLAKEGLKEVCKALEILLIVVVICDVRDNGVTAPSRALRVLATLVLTTMLHEHILTVLALNVL